MYKSSAWKYSFGIRFLCIIGILLSSYSLYVKNRIAKDVSYEAMCDISDRIKCSKVFDSKYGSGFGIFGSILGSDKSIFNQPNGVNGIIFYTLLLLLDLSVRLQLTKIEIILSLFANLMSIYLAYLLYFVFENFCIVCVTLYAVNLLLLILLIKKYNNLVRHVESMKCK